MPLQEFIDVRSDTVTQPTEEMRKAMAEAIVGDDVYRDDITTNELEEVGAKMLGKEAALFVPSGTMCNQIGILSHTQRGDEVLLSAQSHIFEHEVGAASVLAGVGCKTLEFPNTIPDAERLERAIRVDDIHQPRTGLICIENALSNGMVIPISNMQDIYSMAQDKGIPVHLDGARLYNGAVALGVDVKELTQYCDTLNCCLSKGLCAPIGSLFAGPSRIVERARKWRKLLGGGMRQTGILAAAGLVSLKEMTKRISIDHENAKYLADKLEKISSIKVFRDRLYINMVFFLIDRPADELAFYPAKMLEHGVKMLAMNENQEWRWVTHYGIDKEQIDHAVASLEKVIMGQGNI